MVAALCRRYNVICLMDEVYEWLTYSGSQHIKLGINGDPVFHTTVEPLNNGHIGTDHFVLYREVVLFQR